MKKINFLLFFILSLVLVSCKDAPTQLLEAYEDATEKLESAEDDDDFDKINDDLQDEICDILNWNTDYTKEIIKGNISESEKERINEAEKKYKKLLKKKARSHYRKMDVASIAYAFCRLIKEDKKGMEKIVKDAYKEKFKEKYGDGDDYEKFIEDLDNSEITFHTDINNIYDITDGLDDTYNNNMKDEIDDELDDTYNNMKDELDDTYNNMKDEIDDEIDDTYNNMKDEIDDISDEINDEIDDLSDEYSY